MATTAEPRYMVLTSMFIVGDYATELEARTAADGMADNPDTGSQPMYIIPVTKVEETAP